jgi:hypothetical protein
MVCPMMPVMPVMPVMAPVLGHVAAPVMSRRS